VKAWVTQFAAKMILDKGVKHAVSAVLGLLGTAVFAAKVKPVLDQLGVSVDPNQLAVGLTAFFSGAAGWLINWAQKVASHNAPAPQN
jgi:hypothetical protein